MGPSAGRVDAGRLNRPQYNPQKCHQQPATPPLHEGSAKNKPQT